MNKHIRFEAVSLPILRLRLTSQRGRGTSRFRCHRHYRSEYPCLLDLVQRQPGHEAIRLTHQNLLLPPTRPIECPDHRHRFCNFQTAGAEKTIKSGRIGNVAVRPALRWVRLSHPGSQTRCPSEAMVGWEGESHWCLFRQPNSYDQCCLWAVPLIGNITNE